MQSGIARRSIGIAIAWLGVAGFAGAELGHVFAILQSNTANTVRVLALALVLVGLFVEIKRQGAQKPPRLISRPVLFGLLLFAAVLLAGLLVGTWLVP